MTNPYREAAVAMRALLEAKHIALLQCLTLGKVRQEMLQEIEIAHAQAMRPFDALLAKTEIASE